MKHQLLFVLLLLFGLSYDLSAQKTLEALRTSEIITLDGKLDEDVWCNAQIAKDFISWRPNPGTKPNKQTEVRIIYDDSAIYIGATMFEASRDSIMVELTQRDDLGNTDWFGVIFDTYGQGTAGFEFIIGATGVQFDAQLTQNGEDTRWNEIWFSEVALNDDSWVAEIKIPYSAIRFPKKEIQEWKLNFLRKQARTEQRSSWQFIDPNGVSFLQQVGILTGIKNIEPPLRLFLSPYVSTYFQHSHDANRVPVNSTGYSYNGGLDLKYGINDAFTLDMTLVPDFGQVQSDDQVLNLSPFEVFFSENRPFFTEGLELFNKTNLFYSRRVGGRPIGFSDVYSEIGTNEELVSNPQNAQLLNASKISGRTAGGLGIGVFNGISKETTATIRNTEDGTTREFITSPFSNYNIVILDQNLKNNSSVTFVNSSVLRKGDRYHNANVTSGSYTLKPKSQLFETWGLLSVSQLYFPQDDNVFGIEYELGGEKILGPLNYGINYKATSRNFEPNDFGFLRRSNSRELGIWANYQIFNPFSVFNRGNLWFNFNYERLYNPNVYARTHFNTGFWFETKGLWQINMWANARPESYDYFEPRVEGRYLTIPAFENIGFWIGSDNRKRLRVSTNISVYNLHEEGRWGFNYNVSPRFRFSNNFTVRFSTGVSNEYNAVGWVDNINNGDIIMGYRDQKTISNILSAFYNVSENMGFNIRIRHYWSKVYYHSFHQLLDNGGLKNSDYAEFRDFSFNLLNIDFNYNWRFAPGSDLFFTWKNSIAGSQYSNEIDFRDLSYSEGLKKLGDFPQNNSLSVRLVYYLDFNRVRDIF